MWFIQYKLTISTTDGTNYSQNVLEVLSPDPPSEWIKNERATQHHLHQKSLATYHRTEILILFAVKETN